MTCQKMTQESLQSKIWKKDFRTDPAGARYPWNPFRDYQSNISSGFLFFTCSFNDLSDAGYGCLILITTIALVAKTKI